MSNSKAWRTTWGTINWKSASEKEVLDAVEQLLRAGAGAKVNIKDDWGDTVLMRAVSKGYLSVVKRLLTVPDIDVNVKNKGKNTALISAAWNGYTEIVDALLSFPNIDVNAENGYATALSAASQNGHVRIVKKLLSFPKINVKTKGVKEALEGAEYLKERILEEERSVRMRYSLPYDSLEDNPEVKKQNEIIKMLTKVEKKIRHRKRLADELKAVRRNFASDKMRKAMPNMVQRFQIRRSLVKDLKHISNLVRE